VLEFNDLLLKCGIDPKTVLMLRLRPKEQELRKVLPLLAAERPDTFNAYQQTQYPNVEKAMLKADYVASFIGHEGGKALFVGVYRRGASRPLTHEQYWQMPENVELRTSGLQGFLEGDRDSVLWFELAPVESFSEWKGRMVVNWPGTEQMWWPFPPFIQKAFSLRLKKCRPGMKFV
jgi:hypothetical protein